MKWRDSIRSALRKTCYVKPLVFFILAIPLFLLTYLIWIDYKTPGSGLGVDPEQALVKFFGEWGLRILLLTLATSSLSRLAAIPELIRYRRIFGLWSFAYIVLHFTVYFAVLAELNLSNMVDDFTKRPYITVGLSALFLLIPLAVTSTRGWQRRLKLNWSRLHMLVYLIVILAWLHLFWLSKSSYLDAFIYGVMISLLFVERVMYKIYRHRRAAMSKSL